MLDNQMLDTNPNLGSKWQLDQFLGEVYEDLRHQPGAISAGRIKKLLAKNSVICSEEQLLKLTQMIRDQIDGLGDLESLLTNTTSDLLVNADGSVWIEEAGKPLRRTNHHLSPEQARKLATRLAALGGRRLDDSTPYVDAQLPSGLRLHAVLPPLSSAGTLISLRRLASEVYTLDELLELGTLNELSKQLLTAIIDSRSSFLISGGTGSGKTTLMNTLLSAAAATERILIVEDASELKPAHPHVVSLQSRHANSEGKGEVTLADLVRQCLRMRPDRIVVGECRGAEIRELLQALNTGHAGGAGTIHANSVQDVPARLEALGSLAGLSPEALALQAVSALDFIIHIHKGSTRTVAALGALQLENGRITTSLLASFTPGKTRVFKALDAYLPKLSLTPIKGLK